MKAVMMWIPSKKNTDFIGHFHTFKCR